MSFDNSFILIKKEEKERILKWFEKLKQQNNITKEDEEFAKSLSENTFLQVEKNEDIKKSRTI